jgi:hypothetical protein
MLTLQKALSVGILLGMMCFGLPSTGSGNGESSGSVQGLTSASLSLYSTFRAMGVNVDIAAVDDPDLDATATVEYRRGSGPVMQGFPLSRVSATRFSGSLFWLQHDSPYTVRVTLSDPDGGPLNGVTLVNYNSTRAEIYTFDLPDPTQSFYVSPNGIGTACNQSAPCALSYALGQVQASQAIILLSGVYYQGAFTIPHSGNYDAPIVIRGMDRNTTILDGGDPTDFNWTSVGNGIYRTKVNVANPHLVTADGERLFPYVAYNDLTNNLWGIPGFYADGTTVYIRLDGNANPNNVDMVVSRYNNAFTIEQDYIYFENLTFRHYGNGDYAKAIYLNNANFNLITSCTFAINDLGIGIKRASGENVIEHNEFYDTDFDWPWDSFKTYDSRLETGGIRFYSPTTGRGNVIRYNFFHDYFDGFGACPEEAGTDSMEYDIYGNYVYNAGDDGMETDGTCSNVRIWDNKFENVLMGISLAPTYIGPTYAIRNLIYNTGVGNNDYSGSPFKFNSGYDKSGPMYLFHNTAVAGLPGNNGLYIKSPGSWDMIYARNNIWMGTDYAINNYNTSQPIDLDYDDLLTSNPSEFVYWGDDENRHMHDLATFQNLTGQELHGLNIEPDFYNEYDGSYSLAFTSPLIDAGVYIPGINDEYSGAAPDIGAYEYFGPGFELIVQPPNQSIGPGETTSFQISLETTSSFTDTVSLSYDVLPTGLIIDLTPSVIDASTSATLVVTDTHTAPLAESQAYNITFTGTTAEGIDNKSILIIVGGKNVYLPVILR